MRATARAVLLVTLLLLPFGWTIVRPAAVHACSIGDFGSEERHREELLKSLEGSDVVLVGMVVDERKVGAPESTDVYDSIVVAEAVLAGELQDFFRVRQLAYDDTFCRGGPRLREGERVLLALDSGQANLPGDNSGGQGWRLHGFMGKVAITPDEAVSQYASVGVAMGDPEGLVQDYGRALGTGEMKVDDAIAAVTSPIEIPAEETLPAGLEELDLSDDAPLPTGVIVTLVTAAGVGLLLIARAFRAPRHRRRRPVRGRR